MKTPKIAVILAVYNGMEWLEEQLNSILMQNQVDIQIFISIDDGSTDKSEELCIEFSQRYKNIVVLPNIGRFGSAKENFFRLIRDVNLLGFEHLALSDQDDIWGSDKLSTAIKIMTNSNVDAFSSNVTAFWPDGKKMLIDKAQDQCKFDFMFESAGPGCTFVLTRKVALHLQGFLIQNQHACKNVALHDWFIYAFARVNGYKWLIDKQPHMDYRQHEKNVVGANVGLNAKITRWNQLRAGWLHTQAILLADIIGYSDSWVIQRLKRNNLIDKCVLSINVTQFRRKFTDSLVLALSFIVGLKK